MSWVCITWKVFTLFIAVTKAGPPPSAGKISLDVHAYTTCDKLIAQHFSYAKWNLVVHGWPSE